MGGHGLHGVEVHAFMPKARDAQSSICLHEKRCDCKKNIFIFNRDGGSGITSDGREIEGTEIFPMEERWRDGIASNENAASQHCHHQMHVGTNTHKKLVRVLG